MVVEARTVEMDAAGLARVEEMFADQIARGLHPGAAMAVYRHGQLVLDLFAGVADEALSRPVTDSTMFVLFSSTKPLAAACLFLLKERGKLSYDDKVAEHWPGFGQNGKEATTVRHFLTHQSGMPQTPPDLTWERWRDWDAVVQAMESATPEYAPGVEMAYHTYNFGWLVAELVHRVDGRPFPQFLREEVTGPLGMADTYVGLPSDLEDRVSYVHVMDDGQPGDIAHTCNRPEVHQAVVRGACGIATARDLARFYAMLEQGGTLDGVRVLAPETVAEGAALQVEGHDRTVGHRVRRSLGPMLGEPRMGTSTDDHGSFGHGGAGTSIGWADPSLGLAVVVITNGFRGRDSNEERLAALSRAVRQSCL